MNPKLTHPWNLNEAEAQQLQQQLASQVIKQDQLNPVQRVAGVDVAYDESNDRFYCSLRQAQEPSSGNGYEQLVFASIIALPQRLWLTQNVEIRVLSMNKHEPLFNS